MNFIKIIIIDPHFAKVFEKEILNKIKEFLLKILNTGLYQTRFEYNSSKEEKLCKILKKYY